MSHLGGIWTRTTTMLLLTGALIMTVVSSGEVVDDHDDSVSTKSVETMPTTRRRAARSPVVIAGVGNVEDMMVMMLRNGLVEVEMDQHLLEVGDAGLRQTTGGTRKQFDKGRTVFVDDGTFSSNNNQLEPPRSQPRPKFKASGRQPQKNSFISRTAGQKPRRPSINRPNQRSRLRQKGLQRLRNESGRPLEQRPRNGDEEKLDVFNGDNQRNKVQHPVVAKPLSGRRGQQGSNAIKGPSFSRLSTPNAVGIHGPSKFASPSAAKTPNGLSLKGQKRRQKAFPIARPETRVKASSGKGENIGFMSSRNFRKSKALKFSGGPNRFESLFHNRQDMPSSSFTCAEQRFPGLYADLETDCQVYHMCHRSGQRSSFRCPEGTSFDQRYMICNWKKSVDCKNSFSFFNKNKDLYV